MICTESFEDSFKHQHINLNDLLLTRSTTARETHREFSSLGAVQVEAR